MDISATQIYEDDDFSFTQKISHDLEEESVQVGTLSIDSTNYQIKTGTTKIGRHSSCDIVINDATVSKVHAEIEASEGQASTWISDLNSSNKTKLNKLILRPTRLYELKEGSVIEFGRVRATYRTYCPADNTVIPETPAPPRQKVASVIIPNTPDSSLNNSSGVDDDGSIILGTQKDDEDRIFRRPRISQCQSTSIDKKNTPMNKNNNSRNTILHTTDLNVRENQVSIFDAETQKFEEGHKTASKSIHDVETQGILTDVSEHLVEANATTGKQLSELNICDKTTGRSVIDIHDIEMQNYVDDINEIETQKSKSNIHIVTGKKLTADIHIMKIQDYVGDTDESGSDTQKSEIGKNNDRKKNLAELGRDIHDLETQKFDDKYIAEDISDLETQLELNNIAKCEQSRDISDMETQFVTDGMAIETSNNRADKYKDKNRIANTTKDAVNRENITKSPKSRSNSPGSLNLSSPGIEDCPSSPLNQSGHLLESTCLLEFFGEDIDKQENMQASNASTKPPTKVSTERNSNVENVRNTANNEENNDEDIFEALTQRESHKFEALMSDDSEADEKDVPVTYKVSKKKRGTPRLEQTNDDSETDAEEYIAELAIKQRESSGTSNKLSNNEEINNRNDPSTSIESEDMFDVLTQRLDNPTTKDTLNALINQSKKTNEINRAVNDMESTEISNNYDQDSRTSIEQTDINDAPTQLFLLRETSPKTVINSKDIAAKNNQNNVDGMATTHVINAKSVECCTTENLDSENIDYELAPTQVIGEIENKEKRTSNRENDSSQVNLNDTLEQRLNEMFDNVNNDTNNIHELPLMSTQILEDILQSSQCDDSTNKSITEVHNRGTNSVQRKQLRRKNVSPCNQYSDNLADTEVNADNISTAETDSQNSDTYFSTITTRRKRNILKDTQEFVEDIALCQNVDSSRTSKANNKEDTDDNKDMEFNERRKRVSKKKNKSDPMKTLNDNNRNKAISSENNEINNEKSFRNLPRQKDKASEASKQVLGRNQTKFKVDDAEENISISTPCSSAAEQRVKTLDTLYESDDDILMRLPVVRISGTFSNPASPSASSTSTVRSTKSIRDIAKSKKKKPIDLRGKSLRKRDVGNSEKNNKSSADSHPNSITSPIVKISGLVDTSEDSETDSETKYKFQRFQQMADRMLGNELRYLKRQDKGNSKNTHVSSDISDIPEDPKQNTDVESKSSTRSSRMIRNKRSSKQSDKSSRDIQKETREKNKVYGDRSTKTEIKSIVAKRMVSSNMVEENTEQITLKKRKTAQVTEEYPVATRGRRNIMKTATDRQSPNILKYFTKMNSRESSPIIEKNTKSSEDNKTISKTALEKTHETSLSTETDGNADSERSNVKRSRRIINRQVTTHISDVTVSEISKKNKPALTKGTEVQVSQSQEKVLRVVLNPIKNLSDNESQEIERIMAKGPSNAQDKNSSIRESNKAKIFQRKLRTRSRKRSNSDIETDSVLIESTSSGIEDSDNTQFNNTVPTTKRKRFAKNSVSSLSEADVSQKKEETFKKPSRVKNSKNLTLDSSENTLSESSQESTESDASTSSRVSRSKAASIRKKEKLELNQDTHKLINESASRLNTSVEITSLSMSSRTRRSTSLLSNSTLSAMKHKVLFTGITEDYSKIVKTLGGSKVEDPAKCTILVIDKVRRTYKFLCTLAKGIPIVAIDWLRDSEAAERFLDWENYILKDPAAEAKFGFRLRKSLDKAKEKKLLDGYTVVLTPNVAPPPVEELKNMVLSCGGKALLRPPTKWPERAIVLSREEDMANARKFLAKAPKTITVQSTEFILTGILRQETDFNKYKLM